jgi:pantetheine-phosphate adenylyltransferase
MGLIGFYAGSFDPFTNGHLQIVKKTVKCFEKVIIGIGSNTEKPLKINKKDMKEAIEQTVKEENLRNVEVVIYDGLTVDKAKELKVDLLIRGLRNGTDYQYEENISEMNEKISGIDTCYFRAGNLGYISSSLVMELYKSNKNIDNYVPKPVAELLRNKIY